MNPVFHTVSKSKVTFPVDIMLERDACESFKISDLFKMSKKVY